jgi:hypothetical protein
MPSLPLAPSVPAPAAPATPPTLALAADPAAAAAVNPIAARFTSVAAAAPALSVALSRKPATAHPFTPAPVLKPRPPPPPAPPPTRPPQPPPPLLDECAAFRTAEPRRYCPSLHRHALCTLVP